jgi:hypothetical protein
MNTLNHLTSKVIQEVSSKRVLSSSNTYYHNDVRKATIQYYKYDSVISYRGSSGAINQEYSFES